MIKKQYLPTLALTVAMTLGLSACSDDKTEISTVDEPEIINKATQAKGSDILSYIPADTPVLAVFTHDESNPLPENFKQKMNSLYSNLADFFKKTIKMEMAKKSDEDSAETQEMVEKWLSQESLDRFGLSFDENEWALYAINLSPVLRTTLGKTHKMGEVLDELMAMANDKKPDTATKTSLNGSDVYLMGDKEVKIIVSLKGNSLVATLAPSHKSEELMPQLLGFEKPAKNILSSNQYKSTLEKYNYLSSNLTWVNFRQIADYFVNPSKYNSPILDLMQIEDNKFSQVCKAEILEMVDKAPRIVAGTQKLEEHLMKSHLAWEMDSDIGNKLSTMTGRIPKASDTAKMTYGFSFDIAAAKQVAQDFANGIQQDPFECELFTKLNMQVGAVQQQLNQPLPPFVSNFKGINIVLDELDLDFSQTEPEKIMKNIQGNVLLAVDNPEALKGMAEMMMPELQKLGLTKGGDAVNVSSLIPVKGSMIPINLDHVFMAMGDETIGLSIGDKSNTSLQSSVGNKSDNSLLNFKITADLYKNMFSGISKITDKLPEKQKAQLNLQNSMMTDFLWWESEEANINFTPNGLEVFMDIVY